MSQPTFCSELLSSKRPIKTLRHIHCGKQSFGACVGEWEDIQKLPIHPEIPSQSSQEPESDERVKSDEEMTSMFQESIRAATPAALELFYGKKSHWYYLGQRSYSTIHGPYDGQRMFSWFQQGWLSLDLHIWKTMEESASVDLKDFRPLKEHLAQISETRNLSAKLKDAMPTG